MRKYILLAAVMFVFASCAGNEAAKEYYADEELRYTHSFPESLITYNQGLQQWNYNESGLDLLFDLDRDKGFAFTIQANNTTDEMASIDWRRTYYVDSRGGKHNIIREGLNWWDDYQALGASEIPPGGEFSTVIRPAVLVNRDGATRLAPLSEDQRAVDDWAEDIKLFIYMEVRGEGRYYHFSFDLEPFEGVDGPFWIY